MAGSLYGDLCGLIMVISFTVTTGLSTWKRLLLLGLEVTAGVIGLLILAAHTV